MKFLLISLFLFSGVLNAASEKSKEESFRKVKNLYIAHMQKKLIHLSEASICMAAGTKFSDLRKCAEVAKSEIAMLDKKAKDAHNKANKKK